MNKTTLVVIVVFVVLIGGYFLLRGDYQTPTPQTPQSLTIPVQTQQPISETESPTQQSTREINMVSDSFSFNPKNLTLAKGQPVKINISNVGIHTFTVDELGINTRLQEFSNVVEFTPTKAGTFTFYCAIPGHREGGMIGTLKVE